MPVQARPQPLLVQKVGDETDTTAQHEQTVQHAHLEVILGLLGAEGAAVAQQVDEADGDAAVDVEDQVVLLGGCDGFDSEGVVEELGGGEVEFDVVLHELDAEIGVVAGFDTVADAGDCMVSSALIPCKIYFCAVCGGRTEFVLLPHGVDKVTRAQALVVGPGELLGGAVESAAEARTDGQQTGDERADEVLAGTGRDNGVHGAGNGRTVVGGQHENHLQEAAGIVGQAATEPKERHDAADADVLLEDVGDGHAGVQQLLATVVGDGGDESGRLSDETELLGPRVIDRDLGNHRLGLGLDGAVLDELLVDLGEEARKLFEGVGNEDAGLAHGLVLHRRRLQLRVGKGAGVAELHLGLQHARNRSNRPRNDRLCDLAGLDRVDDAVFLHATHLTEQKEDLAIRVGLISEHVIDKCRAGISVTADGDAFKDAVGGVGDDVVQLVRHATGLGHVRDRAGPVELGRDDVVHHAAGVADLERTGLDAADGGRADDGDTPLLRDVQDLASALKPSAASFGFFQFEVLKAYPFRHTFGDDCNRPDLRVLHELHCGLVDGSRGGEVDDGVDVAVLGDGLLHRLVNGQESLAGAPVHLAHELAAEGVDDARDRGRLTLADKVKVEHALDRSWLETAAVERGQRSISATSAPRRLHEDVATTYYTKHRVLGWKRVCAAGGLKGRLGAWKRRMLSLAERRSLPPACDLGAPFATGTTDGIVGGYREVKGRSKGGQKEVKGRV